MSYILSHRSGKKQSARKSGPVITWPLPPSDKGGIPEAAESRHGIGGDFFPCSESSYVRVLGANTDEGPRSGNIRFSSVSMGEAICRYVTRITSVGCKCSTRKRGHGRLVGSRISSSAKTMPNLNYLGRNVVRWRPCLTRSRAISMNPTSSLPAIVGCRCNDLDPLVSVNKTWPVLQSGSTTGNTLRLASNKTHVALTLKGACSSVPHMRGKISRKDGVAALSCTIG